MKNISKIFVYCLLFASVIVLSSCGKMSEPRPIENSGYPHVYPRY